MTISALHKHHNISVLLEIKWEQFNPSSKGSFSRKKKKTNIKTTKGQFTFFLQENRFNQVTDLTMLLVVRSIFPPLYLHTFLSLF